MCVCVCVCERERSKSLSGVVGVCPTVITQLELLQYSARARLRQRHHVNKYKNTLGLSDTQQGGLILLLLKQDPGGK